MNDQMAKMKVLQQIMDLFSDQQLSGLKKKGQPDMMAVSVKADGDGKSDPLAALADSDDAKKSDDDGDEAPDLLQKLAEMYSGGDSDKPEDDDDKAC